MNSENDGDRMISRKMQNYINYSLTVRRFLTFGRGELEHLRMIPN